MLNEIKNFLDEIYEDPVIIVKTETNKYVAKVIGFEELIVEKYKIEDGKEVLETTHIDNPAFFYKLCQSAIKMFDKVLEPCVEVTREFSDDFSLYHYDLLMSNDKVKIMYSEKQDGEWTSREQIEFDKSPELLTFFKTIVSEIESME